MSSTDSSLSKHSRVLGFYSCLSCAATHCKKHLNFKIVIKPVASVVAPGVCARTQLDHNLRFRVLRRGRASGRLVGDYTLGPGGCRDVSVVCALLSICVRVMELAAGVLELRHPSFSLHLLCLDLYSDGLLDKVWYLRQIQRPVLHKT